MPIPNLSDAALLSHTAPEIFARGQSYAESGAVEAIIQRGNLLIAGVEGSQYEPYRVEVAIDGGGIAGATCTCPYDWGGWCKHIVAVLLTCRATPEVVQQRPSPAELLNPLSRDQLQELLLMLARRMPAVLELLEHELLQQQATSGEAQAAPAAPDQRRTAVDTRSYRRQAEAIVGAVHSMRSGMEIYNYTSTAVHQMDDLIAQAHTFTENGDGDNALRILDAITEPYVNHWFELDGSSGAAGDLFTELGMVWTEALLTADLTRDEREEWQGKLEYWQTEVAEYGIDSDFEPAIGAARQGWDDPEVVAVLLGDTTDWADQADPLDYTTQQITAARLNVLERQGRADEFLNLARAANELPRYATMLVRVGRVPEAVETGLTHLTHAAQALTLATTLHDQGATDAALQVAEHGLTLAESRAPLAGWLCRVARQQGRHEPALRAAEVAFRSAPNLQSYHAVQDLAGERWEQIRAELLDYLRTYDRGLLDYRVDIFLHEDLIDDAIATVESGYSYEALDRVLTAAVTRRPNWVIQAGTHSAEQIINAGKAQYYDVAVQRLGLVRRAYLHAGHAEEWQRYLAELRTTHGRKRKLVDLLKQVG